jgi:hypothetical protein
MLPRVFAMAVSRAPDTVVITGEELFQPGIGVHDVGLEYPTLDDVFAALTGDPAEGTAHGTAHDTGRLEMAAA